MGTCAGSCTTSCAACNYVCSTCDECDPKVDGPFGYAQWCATNISLAIDPYALKLRWSEVDSDVQKDYDQLGANVQDSVSDWMPDLSLHMEGTCHLLCYEIWASDLSNFSHYNTFVISGATEWPIGSLDPTLRFFKVRSLSSPRGKQVVRSMWSNSVDRTQLPATTTSTTTQAVVVQATALPTQASVSSTSTTTPVAPPGGAATSAPPNNASTNDTAGAAPSPAASAVEVGTPSNSSADVVTVNGVADPLQDDVVQSEDAEAMPDEPSVLEQLLPWAPYGLGVLAACVVCAGLFWCSRKCRRKRGGTDEDEDVDQGAAPRSAGFRPDSFQRASLGNTTQHAQQPSGYVPIASADAGTTSLSASPMLAASPTQAGYMVFPAIPAPPATSAPVRRLPVGSSHFR